LVRTPQPAVVNWWLVAAGWISGLVAASIYALWIKQTGNWNNGLAWELSLLRSIPRPLPVWIDTILYYMPWVGTNWTLVPVAFIAGTWLWRKGRHDLGLHLIIVQIGTLSLHQSVKALFDRDRPSLWPRRGQYAQASYPSGHMVTIIGTMFTIAVMLHRERGWKWPYVVAGALLVLSAYSRLYLGVHWPADIVGGVLAGICWLTGTLLAFHDARGGSPSDRTPLPAEADS
jgi:undecaprenyl-diphosphatase